MSKKEEKTYTPEEAARAVLQKAQEMLKKSSLYKANTAHEIEAGEEPKNDDAEAPEYLANADIESSKGSDKKKVQSEHEEDHDDEMEDREIAEEEAEEEVEEHEDEYHKSEDLEKEDHTEIKPEHMKKMQKMCKGDMKKMAYMKKMYKKCGGDMEATIKKCGNMEKMHKSEDKTVEQAAKDIMGDKDLDEVLDRMPSDKRDDVLAKLREMKKKGMSKSKMMGTCKSELAKCGDMKQMKKSEQKTSGMGKLYSFLAKSAERKMEPTRMATPEEMESLKEAKAKKEKKEKLKKMAGGMAPKAPKDMMKPQTNATMPPMPSGKQGY